jgi:hypothetical protein
MLRLEWVEEELERVRAGTCTMQTVRDYALLCIARDSLRGERFSHSPPVVPELDEKLGPPTLDQIERAIGEVVLSSDADRKRARDALTWVQIMRGDG